MKILYSIDSEYDAFINKHCPLEYACMNHSVVKKKLFAVMASLKPDSGYYELYVGGRYKDETCDKVFLEASKVDPLDGRLYVEELYFITGKFQHADVTRDMMKIWTSSDYVKDPHLEYHTIT
jgi:hypothetical protein